MLRENKNTMKRLYSVPSEKLRVWTCWLNKVGDRAEDWQWWLRAQIRLTVRISDLLQKANLALEEEKNEKFDGGDDPAEPEVATESEGAEKLDVATEPQVRWRRYLTFYELMYKVTLKFAHFVFIIQDFEEM